MDPLLDPNIHQYYFFRKSIGRYARTPLPSFGGNLLNLNLF